MNWGDDLLLEKSTPIRGQLQLAMYAVHVASGSSLTCRQLKLATIKQYVLAAASFLALFCGRDLRKVNPSDTQYGPYLHSVFKDLEQYEKVPNRREPYTPEMHEECEKLAALSRPFQPLGVHSVMATWFTIGLLGGFRLSEWAQYASNSDPHKPRANHLLPPELLTRALVADDIRIETLNRRRYTGLAILNVPLSSIRKLWVKFRTQKNRQNGEERLWTLNDAVDGHCMVASFYSVLGRFSELLRLDSTLDKSTTPLALFFDYVTRRVRSVTSTEIEAVMRHCASIVCGLHPVHDKEKLEMWSSHSLRVGACVILHAMGFSTIDIQWILRWRSLAFMAYLRNLAGLADRQNVAIDKARGMPHFF